MTDLSQWKTCNFRACYRKVLLSLAEDLLPAAYVYIPTFSSRTCSVTFGDRMQDGTRGVIAQSITSKTAQAAARSAGRKLWCELQITTAHLVKTCSGVSKTLRTCCCLTLYLHIRFFRCSLLSWVLHFHIELIHFHSVQQALPWRRAFGSSSSAASGNIRKICRHSEVSLKHSVCRSQGHEQ